MGIRGLETFIDHIYNSEDRRKVFDDLLLSDLKLVIDGNQFVYTLTSLARHGHYGGNYDQFYSIAKQLLTKLKPSIEIIIFDGAKESTNKCRYRLEQKVLRLANSTQENKPKLTKKEHLNVLREQPSLFNRHILYNLLNELNIDYHMTEGPADHVIALYANGHNSTKKKFTVLSKASFFNVYLLDKGYLSSKYAIKMFQNLHQLDSVTFPVFRLDKLVKFFCLESHRTWIYFCIMLGNNDDPELKRNTVYFKEFKINTSGGCMNHLIAHLKLEEKTLLESNYSRIRSSYIFKQDIALKKIDQLIDLFEMKDSEYQFAQSLLTNSKINDFDRIYLTIKNLNCFFINCLVENYQEDSVFQPSIDLIHCLYSILFSKSCVKFSQIDEYIRTKDPIDQSLIDVCSITSDMFNKAYRENKCLNVLNQIELKMDQFNIKDNLTLFFVSLVLWTNWLNIKMVTAEAASTVNSKIFNDAVIINFLILSLDQESDPILSNKDVDLTCENLLKKVKKCNKTAEILALYNKLIKHVEKEPDLNEYFEIDIKLVHRLNEFQAIYYVLGALCRLNNFKFELLKPNRFLNSFFCINYIKYLTIIKDENNNSIENEYAKIDSLVKTCESTISVWKIITNKIEFCKKLINKTSLKELLNSLRV